MQNYITNIPLIFQLVSGHCNFHLSAMTATRNPLADVDVHNLPFLLPCFSLTDSGLCSAPSMFPSPRYCDLTHLHALYTDPLTRLNYHDVKQFEQARNLSREQIRARLEMRNKQSMLQLD